MRPPGRESKGRAVEPLPLTREISIARSGTASPGTKVRPDAVRFVRDESLSERRGPPAPAVSHSGGRAWPGAPSRAQPVAVGPGGYGRLARTEEGRFSTAGPPRRPRRPWRAGPSRRRLRAPGSSRSRGWTGRPAPCSAGRGPAGRPGSTAQEHSGGAAGCLVGAAASVESRAHHRTEGGIHDEWMALGGRRSGGGDAGRVGGPAPAQSGPVKMEWLSWSIFRFTSPTGKVIVTNPFVTNPDSPVKVADFPKVDVIVVADGHRDEVGSTRRDRDQDRGEDHHALRDVDGLLRAAEGARGAAAPEQPGRLVPARRSHDPQRRARCTGRGRWTS